MTLEACRGYVGCYRQGGLLSIAACPDFGTALGPKFLVAVRPRACQGVVKQAPTAAVTRGPAEV